MQDADGILSTCGEGLHSYGRMILNTELEDIQKETLPKVVFR